MAPEIVLDGGEGEGGGQVLRSALALSLATGRAFEMVRVRAGREEPGLRAHHLPIIEAARTIAGGFVEGASEGSQRLLFTPGGRGRAGTYELDAGPGAATLLLQLLALPLALSGAPSRLTIRGGTHFPGAPTFHDLVLGWAPLLEAQGFGLELSLAAAGFSPEGGGRIDATVRPAAPARSLDLRRRGTLGEVRLIPMAAGVDADVPVRMAAAAERGLRQHGVAALVESQPLPAGTSRGAALALAAAYDRVTVTFGSLGAQPAPLPVTDATKVAAARPAEAVGREVAEAFAAHHASGMALDEYLADQIVLPLAVASAGLQGGPTPIHRFTCTRVTAHLLATAAVVRRFLPVEVAVFGREGEPGDVRVAPAGIGEVVRLRG